MKFPMFHVPLVISAGRLLQRPLLAAGLSLVTLTTPAADWPTYRGDYARSGVSKDALPPRLTEAWTWRSVQPPQPAWQGEAKWDGWNKVYDMKPRQIFDRAFHTAIADGRVFFGSSADDKLYCLDTKTGREIWTYFAEGPIRLAPTIEGDRVFFGSDDGCITCLDAASGSVIWRQRAVESDRRIPGNGRVISNWPVRSSVIVLNGVAYATAGMFPSEGVHIVGLDAATGAVRWRQIQTDLPAQGYLLASASKLYVPAGRNNPVVCNLADGKRLHVVEGSGGTYALLTGDLLVFGPGKTGQLNAVEEDQKDQLATFQGSHMIVTPTRSYLHSDTELSALDRARYLELARRRKELSTQQAKISKDLRALAKKAGTEADQARAKDKLAELGVQIDATTEAMEHCVLWRADCPLRLELILAGNVLIAGGGNQIAGYDLERGTQSWKLPVSGDAYGLAVAGGSLFVSTDRGVIHCFGSHGNQASLTQ
ncbi:MAG: PQQ-binding-like beta-propeller repeat protein [Verrucomicrobiales bacterium]|nr:PQQ-binding-like beta-propeller repeat protein [Verrucomicrobiales bacterium]